ncbi:MAG: PAS domain S-box protein [Spirochaetales bacterium]|nr:PAS domain S-box protein [Spirochaetales bacterium]MCF7938303.1 PAS domain S-box protein [Spirochaetales bacterium]
MTHIIFAVADPEERRIIGEIVRQGDGQFSIAYPETVDEADHMLQEYPDNIIVTDFSFQNGGFAEWLFLWQRPFILIAERGEDDKISSLVLDYSCDFLVRDPEYRHLTYLPLKIQKVLRTIESAEQQNVHIQLTEQRYRELVQALPDIIYTLDSEGRFVFVNDSVRSLGYEPLELIGKHFSVILDPEYVPQVSRRTVLEEYRGQETGDEYAPKLFDERRTGERKTRNLEVRLKKKPKTGFGRGQGLYGKVISYGEVSAGGFADSKEVSPHPGTVGIIRDVTDRKIKEQIIQRSLKEKEVLLSEIHHRVKNNLQIMSSLLNLESEQIENEEYKSHFTDSQMQIQSIAMIHEHLYRSETLETINIFEYIESLCTSLFQTYRVNPEQVKLELDIEPLDIEISVAMPVALLLNELISNSLKYAFPEGKEGKITIALNKEGKKAKMQISDDGVGLPADQSIASQESLGHTLVYTLVEQLDGSIEMVEGAGTSFLISFPCFLSLGKEDEGESPSS